MNGDFYNQDYFERGLETGKSCYQNYRWMPELTIPMAMAIVDHLLLLKEHSILDFGCAKGYLVKALRLLNRKAWGVDISRYAISQVPSDVACYCKLIEVCGNDFPKHFDWCIAKDVFEHIDEGILDNVLTNIPARKMFAVIPLGDERGYFAKANNLDCSHVLCKDAEWWIHRFYDNKWFCSSWSYRVEGIKDSYKDQERAHGFFTLEKLRI